MTSRRLLLSIPLIAFAILCVFLYRGLGLDPHRVESPLIGKPAPAFHLPELQHPSQMIEPGMFKGQVWLLNVWGSWCVSCRQEHEVLVALAKAQVVPIVGLNWKDPTADAVGWLDQFGNPYQVSATDADGRTAINYGVYGAPETFVVDKDGIIRDKVIGVLTPEILRAEVIPLIKALQK